MTKITVHANPAITWQRQHAPHMVNGLSALGFDVCHTTLAERLSDIAVVFGTTFFHELEADDDETLLVDRASWGDPDQVQLVWNGRLRRGDHCVPADYMGRPRLVPDHPDIHDGNRIILCGQATPNGADLGLADWYRQRSTAATHYKPHPTQAANVKSFAHPPLPIAQSFIDCGCAITLNSSVGVWCLLNGIDAIADDPGAMIYPYSHGQQSLEECLNWIAWTQWSWAEIADGEPIRHLFDGANRRLQQTE